MASTLDFKSAITERVSADGCTSTITVPTDSLA